VLYNQRTVGDNDVVGIVAGEMAHAVPITACALRPYHARAATEKHKPLEEPRYANPASCLWTALRF